MNEQKITLPQDEEAALRYEVSDAELEMEAAALHAKSYTHQTSAYNRCCR